MAVRLDAQFKSWPRLLRAVARLEKDLAEQTDPELKKIGEELLRAFKDGIEAVERELNLSSPSR